MNTENPKYKEELTTKMHSEFTVSAVVEKEHLLFSAVTCMVDLKYSIDEICEIYPVSKEEIQSYLKEKNSLVSA